MKTILIKAFEIYKEIDGMNREDADKIRGAIADAPLKYTVESEPDNETVCLPTNNFENINKYIC